MVSLSKERKVRYHKNCVPEGLCIWNVRHLALCGICGCTLRSELGLISSFFLRFKL